MHDGRELQPAYAYGGVFKNWILYFHTKINLHFIILQNIWPQYKLFNVHPNPAYDKAVKTDILLLSNI